MIIIPDKLRRPAEVERDELRKHLAEAQAEIENLKWHINSEKAKSEAALELHDRALELVNEARADAEHWKGECSALQRMVHEARAEIERLKKTAEIETILAVTDMYYAAKCNHCGWIGSSKFCVEARAGCADDCEVLCPLCSRHISDDEPSLKDLAEFLNLDVIKIVERKEKLIEQMKNCYNCKFELHAAKECETCNTADCDDSYLYETSNWQPKEPEAAERGE